MMKNLTKVFAVVALAAGAAFFAASYPSTATDITDEEFGQKVRQYLLANPEVIMESVRALEVRETAKREAAAVGQLVSARQELHDDGISFIKGNINGDVTVVEFFDYRCSYCKRVVPDVERLVQKNKDVRLVLKEFPVLGPDSMFAARAAIASDNQGAYSAFHDAMMLNRGPLPNTKVLSLAKSLGMDVERLKRDMKDPKVEKSIQANLALARSLGITGTPSFIIGDAIIPGAVPYDQLNGAVAKARTDCKTC
jgi:protein-disulfide isomerase